MKMTTLFFLILFAVAPVYAQKKTIIEISLIHTPSNTLTIETFHRGSFTPVTKSIVNNKVLFELQLSHLEFFKISITPQIFIVVIARPGDQIFIHADVTDLFNTIEIKGSEYTAQVYSVEKFNLQVQKQIDHVLQTYNSLPAHERTPQVTLSYQQRVDSLQQMRYNKMVSFLRQQYNSPSTLFFIEKLDKNQYFTLYDSIASSLIAQYPETFVVQDFYRRVMAHKRTMIGMPIDNIQLPSPEGDTLSLYPLNARLVIVDFWASWCGHCRRENPLKVRLYEQFKDKGLRYYSISLDKEKQAWVNAIQSDRLVWRDHVSDLKGWNSEVARYFNITGIPANIIVDEHGKILSMNLRGAELERFVQQYLSK